MTYEALLQEGDDKGLIIKEKPLLFHDGRIKGNKIAIRETIETTVQKACVLSEEIAHYDTSVGDVLDMNNVSNRKQELQARYYAANKMVGLCGLIRAFEHHCLNLHETAEFLDVTEEFLLDTIKAYQAKYGNYKTFNNYVIMFNYPNVNIMKFNRR